MREVEVELEPADLQERREEVAIAQEENELEQNRLTETGSELDAREVDLDEREEAVAQTELDLEENTIPGAGTFRVGEDIEPGTYRNTGGNYCFWARLSGYSGEGTDVIAAGNVEEQGFVTISESDLAFETSSCSDWIKQ